MRSPNFPGLQVWIVITAVISTDQFKAYNIVPQQENFSFDDDMGCPFWGTDIKIPQSNISVANTLVGKHPLEDNPGTKVTLHEIH